MSSGAAATTAKVWCGKARAEVDQRATSARRSMQVAAAEMTAVGRKRAKHAEESEWHNASDATKAMMVAGTVLVLDPKFAAAKGLVGNRRNLGLDCFKR